MPFTKKSANRPNSSSLFTLTCLAVCLTNVTHAASETNGSLPAAEAGECYVKALVPASYKQESLERVIKQPSESYSVLPATFNDDKENLLLKDASTEITVTEPEYRENDYQIVVAEATREFVRDSLEGNVAASPGLLFDLEASGFDMDAAEAGQCFYEHYKQPTVESSVEKALVTEATEKLEVVPAVYREEQREVVVKPSYSRILTFPAEYKTVEEKLLIEPSKVVWQKGTGPVQKIDDTTGEIMCRVQLPAVYETFETQVVEKAARTSVVPAPAVRETYTASLLDSDSMEKRTPIEATYEDVTKYKTLDDATFTWVQGTPGDADELGEHTGNVVCVKENPAVIKTIRQTLVSSAGGFESKEIPAIYEEKPVQRLANDATFTTTPVVEITKAFNTRTKIADAHFEWRPVLCETNVTDELVSNVQQALVDKGYDLDLTPGLLSSDTFKAIEAFQQDENLPQGGLTMATLEALGVER